MNLCASTRRTLSGAALGLLVERGAVRLALDRGAEVAMFAALAALPLEGPQFALATLRFTLVRPARAAACWSGGGRCRSSSRRASSGLSGGEQQMLAIGRALMARPK